MRNIYKLIICIVGCQLVGVLGTIFTVSAIQNWYAYLDKPSFAPPNWLFAPAWTTLYLLMGISFYLIWKQGWHKKKVRQAGQYFLAQLLVNFLWSPLFFGLKSPVLGLISILIMWILIIVTIYKFYYLSKIAAYLLIPYLLWVSFATILNAFILMLN